MPKVSENRITQPADRRQPLLKIGEVSKRSGIGIEALRFYERMGLLGHPTRTSSGYRLYDPDVIERLGFIKKAQVLGLTLSEIAQIITEKEAGQSPCAHVREIVRARLRELDQRMAEMRRYRRELGTALAKWDKEGDRKGHVCGLIEATTMHHTLPVTQSKKGKRQ